MNRRGEEEEIRVRETKENKEGRRTKDRGRDQTCENFRENWSESNNSLSWRTRKPLPETIGQWTTVAVFLNEENLSEKCDSSCVVNLIEGEQGKSRRTKAGSWIVQRSF